MGAWTSTFTIGFTLVSFNRLNSIPALSTVKRYRFSQSTFVEVGVIETPSYEVIIIPAYHTFRSTF